MLDAFWYLVKMAAAWIGTGFMTIIFFSYFPHWSSWIILLFILGIIPIKQVQNAWKKLHITGVLKVFVLIVLFFIAVMNTPSSEDETKKPEPTEAITASAEPTITETTEAAILETSVPEIAEVETVPETTLPEITEAPTIPEPAPTQETEEEKMSIAQIATIVEAFAKNSYNNCSVVYDDAGIMLNVWEEGVATGALLAYSGDKEMKSLWNDMSENIGMMSNSLTEYIRGSEQPQIYIAVNVLNDLDEESVILSYLNGVLVYDYVNGIDLIG